MRRTQARRVALATWGAASLLALTAGAAAAQSGRSCRQTLPSDFRRIINTRSQEIIYFRDPVRFLCTGDVRLEADSAVVNRAASTVELVGSVVYQDSARVLTSDWANYLGRFDQLLARGAVVLEDREGGAVIQGEQLNYLRETDTRAGTRMIVTGGRPYAMLPPERGTAAPAPPGRPGPPGVASPEGPPALVLDTPGEPEEDTAGRAEGRTEPAGEDTVVTEVWADRMELEDEVFNASGDVELARGEMTGGGDRARFDRAEERITLTGSAFVRSEEYRLDGQEIDAFLEGDELRQVRAIEDARVVSDELEVDAERVQIGFSGGQLRRLEAWNPDPAAAPRRARASARDFRLRADSIDAQADSIGIRELRAVGRAYGERDAPEDTLRDRRALPGALGRDWIQGDTILGFFSRPGEVPDTVLRMPALPMPGDSAGPRDRPDTVRARPELAMPWDTVGEPARDTAEVVLERIVVVGSTTPALSLYRMASDEDGAPPAINFLKANRIILYMEQGDVSRVEAEGSLEGVYLDPGGGGSDAAEGSEEGAP